MPNRRDQHLVARHHPDHHHEYPEDDDKVRLAFGTGVRYNRPGPKPTLVTEEAGMGQTRAATSADRERWEAIGRIVATLPSFDSHFLISLADELEMKVQNDERDQQPHLQLHRGP